MYYLGEMIYDPDTKEPLEQLEYIQCYFQVLQTQELISSAKLIPKEFYCKGRGIVSPYTHPTINDCCIEKGNEIKINTNE